MLMVDTDLPTAMLPLLLTVMLVSPDMLDTVMVTPPPLLVTVTVTLLARGLLTLRLRLMLMPGTALMDMEDMPTTDTVMPPLPTLLLPLPLSLLLLLPPSLP